MKQKLEQKKYFLSCVSCHHQHRKCDPEEERPCKYCVKTGGECVPRSRKKKRTKAQKLAEETQRALTEVLAKQAGTTLNPLQIQALNINEELIKLREENERLKKSIEEKDSRLRELETKKNGSSSTPQIPHLRPMESLWMLLKFPTVSGSNEVLEDVEILRISQSFQDLLGFKFDHERDNKFSSIIIHDPSIKHTCTKRNEKRLTEKRKMLEYEVVVFTMPLVSKEGTMFAFQVTASMFFEETKHMAFLQVNTFWPLKDISEAVTVFEDEGKVIASKKRESEDNLDKSPSLFSLDFDFLEEKELLSMFPQDEIQLHEFEFDFASNSN